MKEKNFVEEIKHSNRVFIYGAGMVGSLVLSRLRANSIADGCVKFVVSKSTPNQTYLGIPVYGIENCERGDSYAIIVATMPKNQKQIIAALRENGIDCFIPVDDELYEDMERNHISEYMKSHNRIKGDRDVLFMSSDNNYSSGAFLCMLDLCKGMIARGIRPLVVLPGYGNATKMLEDNDIEYTFVQSRSPLIESGRALIEPQMNKNAIVEIERLIKEHNIIIVHNNSNHGYVGAVAARNMKIPYVWHVRENIYEQGFEFFHEKYIYDLVNHADRIITVSKYVGESYKRLNREKVSTIYDGIEIEKYYRKRNILKKEKLKILMPGIMVPLKGQHQLLEAAIKMDRQGLDFDISFIGSGDADYVRKLEDDTKKYRLSNKVHFLERVDNLEDCYFETDIVVVCSKSEAFGRVTIEAQLAGCVVIGAACGATIELIDDGITGYLYELNDTFELADKIKMISDNRHSAERVAKNGQRNAIENYDKKINCEKIINVYREILDNREKCLWKDS